MKRFLVSALCIALLLTGISAPTYAATDGCPETWKVPDLTFKMSSSDFQIYFSRTYDQIIKNGITEFSFDNTNWQKSNIGVFPIQDPNTSEENKLYFLNEQIRSLILSGSEPKYGDDGIINGNLELLKYNQVYIKTPLIVEKKDCKPFTFFFNGEFETPKIVYKDFSQDFLKINNFFRDYQSAEKAKNNYDKCLTDWKSLSLKKDKIIEVQKSCYLGPIFPVKGDADRTIFLSLIPFGKECLKFYQGNSNRSDGWQLAEGSNCKFAVINPSDWNSYSTRTNDANFPKSIIIYDEIMIKGPASTKSKLNDSKQTITCSNGKSKKVITALKPKCPSGYKKL